MGIESDDKSFLIKELLILGIGGILWLVVFVSSCMTCSPLLLVQRHTSESDIDRSSNRS